LLFQWQPAEVAIFQSYSFCGVSQLRVNSTKYLQFYPQTKQSPIARERGCNSLQREKANFFWSSKCGLIASVDIPPGNRTGMRTYGV